MAKRKYILNEEFFYNETPELAYFLGYFMADGHICHNKSRHAITIGLSSVDDDIIKTFNSWISPDRPIYYYNKKLEDGRITKMVQFRIQSKEVCEYLINKYGLHQNKTGNEVVLFKDNSRLFNYFIHGVFDGDGCVRHTKHNRALAEIVCMSLSFLEDVRKLLGFGKISKHRMIYRISFHNNLEVCKFRDMIYESGFIGLERKYKKFYESNHNRFNTNFSEEDLKYIQNNALYKTDREIAVELDRDYRSIQHVSIKNGYRKSKCPVWTTEELALLTELRLKKLSFKEISKYFPTRNCTSIEFQAQKLGIVRPWKITKESIEVIRQNIHLTLPEICKLTNIGLTSAGTYRKKILNGEI